MWVRLKVEKMLLDILAEPWPRALKMRPSAECVRPCPDEGVRNPVDDRWNWAESCNNGQPNIM